jgi:hypothetical protein
VYTNTGGSWIQQAKLTAADGAANSSFGYSVAISGNTIVVGATNAYVNGHTKQGEAYVFTNTTGTWTQQAKLTAPDGAASDQLGYSVAISDNTLVLGAYVGKAYVFTNTGGAWAQQADLSVPSPYGAYNELIAGVAVSGSTVVLGAVGADVFTETNGVWTLQAELNPATSGYVRGPVAISGNTVVLGSSMFFGLGAAYVYTNNGGT